MVEIYFKTKQDYNVIARTIYNYFTYFLISSVNCWCTFTEYYAEHLTSWLRCFQVLSESFLNAFYAPLFVASCQSNYHYPSMSDHYSSKIMIPKNYSFYSIYCINNDNKINYNILKIYKLICSI